ncbi:DUF4235 domain-containing protein [Rothia sp. LK2588]|uniref:DUF4235 domain-containing protein n=1 Tax=Rothia sp. LK2588 TaxID=3114369 RepID=UPI0034CDBE26
MNPIQIVSSAASLGGVALANKILTATWRKVTGNEPPQNNPEDDERWRDILIWAAISGMTGTLIKVFVARAAAKAQAKNKARGGQKEI